MTDREGSESSCKQENQVEARATAKRLLMSDGGGAPRG